MDRINFTLIYLFLFLLPWQTRAILRPGRLSGENWEYGHLGIFATEILLWLIVALWLARRLSFRAVGMILITLLAIYYLWASPDKLLTAQTFAHYAAALAVFLILKNMGAVEKSKAALAFSVGVSFQALLAIHQFLTQTAPVSRWLGLAPHFPWAAGASVIENVGGRFLRAYGGLPHPNILGGYLVISIILLIFLFKNNSKRYLFWSLYLIQLSALFFTFSRSAWLALAVALVILSVAERSRRISLRQRTEFPGLEVGMFKTRTSIAAAILVFAFYSALFYPLLASRLASTDRLEVTSKSERLNQYSEAWQLIKRYPWFGAGPGLYTLALNEILPNKPIWALQPVHNTFVLALAEWGLVGLGLIAFVILRSPAMRNLFRFFSLRLQNDRLIPGLVLLILALFDHYLLSLWSGVVLAATALGLAKSSVFVDKKKNLGY